MKKALPYIVGVSVILLLALLIKLGSMGQQWDERVTLDRKQKIPYGTYVAYNNLKDIFPKATIVVNKKAPGEWDEDVLPADENRHALVIITRQFNASDAELTELYHFVSRGNDVFIAAQEYSYYAESFFHLTTNNALGALGVAGLTGDSLRLQLFHPPYSDTVDYVYPGKRYQSFFGKIDSSATYVLGQSADSLVSFIKLKAGEGNFYLHTAPLAFSNYFLLHKNNMGYYNEVFSSMPWNTSHIAWDEYYVHKPVEDNNKNQSSPFRILLEQPSLAAGIYTAMVALLLFVLLGLKRRQRMIPVIEAPMNDSLDFVKTIGRLYFQKKDNLNLATKMTSFFLEYVHTHFHLTTNEIDAAFLNRLSQKSGVAISVVQSIAGYMQMVHENQSLTDQQLADYYILLDKFYKTA